MTQERQRVITPRRNRFAPQNNRTELPYILDNLGMRDLQTNIPLVSPPQINFLITCIREDFWIPGNIPIWVHWFETGSVFSQARDEAGNMAFNIEMGKKKIPMCVTFNQRTNSFAGLYYNDQEITFQNIEHLVK